MNQRVKSAAAGASSTRSGVSADFAQFGGMRAQLQAHAGDPAVDGLPAIHALALFALRQGRRLDDAKSDQSEPFGAHPEFAEPF